MSKHLGDYDASTVIYGKFTTFRPSTGASYTLGGTPALSVYKDNSLTQSTSGVTLTADFDSVTGLNHFAIDTSSDGTFYAAGSFFDIVITTGTVDSVSVVGSVVASFTIRKDSSLKPTTASRTLDVSAGGEAGLDWANIGSPTTAVNLSATNIDVDQVVASVSGAVGSVTGAVGSVTGAVGSVTGAVGSVTAAVTVGTNNDKTGYALSAAGIQAVWDALTSALTTVGSIGKLLVDNINATISSRLASASYTAPLDAAGTRSAVGLASANLDTQLTAIDDFLDTEIAAIKAKTDNLPTDPADASDIAASFSTVNTTLTTIAGYLDTEVAAILADTTQIKADLPTRITKNTALSAFPFLMVDGTDHVTPKTGLTITATRSIDGAAFAACANSATETGNGWYRIDLAASDMNGNTIALKFSATGADTRNITVITQPT